MLHAAYDRLSESEKKRIDGLLDVQMKALTDPRPLDLIQLYNKTEPGEIYNEMHSILGTELRNVGPELEEYYKAYFDDRGKVVTLAEQYESAFGSSKQRIAAFDQRLEQLKPQIEANEAALEGRQRELEQESARLSNLRLLGDIEAYNDAVPSYNAKIQAYNQLLEETRQLITFFNQLVSDRNAEVAVQNDLSQSINSRFEPAAQH